MTDEDGLIEKLNDVNEAANNTVLSYLGKHIIIYLILFIFFSLDLYVK